MMLYHGIYSPGHNILEPCNILEKIKTTTSKEVLDT